MSASAPGGAPEQQPPPSAARARAGEATRRHPCITRCGRLADPRQSAPSAPGGRSRTACGAPACRAPSCLSSFPTHQAAAAPSAPRRARRAGRRLRAPAPRRGGSGAPTRRWRRRRRGEPGRTPGKRTRRHRGAGGRRPGVCGRIRCIECVAMRRGAPRVRRRLVQLGAIFPQTEIEGDAAALRAFRPRREQAALAPAGLRPRARSRSRPPGWWSAPTPTRRVPRAAPALRSLRRRARKRLEFVTSAGAPPAAGAAGGHSKAATLASSRGTTRPRRRVGWNPSIRGARASTSAARPASSRRQIALCGRLVAGGGGVEGRYHSSTARCGPRPERGAIPIWMGGAAPTRALARGTARRGWFPRTAPRRLAPDLPRAPGGDDAAGIGSRRRISTCICAGRGFASTRRLRGAARAARAGESGSATSPSTPWAPAGAPRQHAEALLRSAGPGA